MWPDAASAVYYVGIGVHAFMAALLGQRFGLRPAVPVAISLQRSAGLRREGGNVRKCESENGR